MKGTHTVEKFLTWLRYSNLRDNTKVNIAHKIRKMADLCSATGKVGRLELTEKDKIIMTFRVFDDGSLIVGVPEGKDKPTFELPPPERDM